MAGTSGGGLRWTGADLGSELVRATNKFHFVISQIMKYEANEGQNYMRSNAPWTDRTANARQGLFARAYEEGSGSKSTYSIVLYHTVPYGIWLEVRWSGKYRIIEPSLVVVGNNVMKSCNRAMLKMRGL